MRKSMLASAVVLAAVIAIPGIAGAKEKAPAFYWGTAGQTTTNQATTPTQLDIPGVVTQVSTTNADWFALRANGSVVEWKTPGATPTVVPFPAGVVISKLADTGPAGTELAIDTKGHAWGWGNNAYGQLCLGNTTKQGSPVKLPFSGVTAIAGAGDHALYVEGGTLYACGGNGYGDLGVGTTAPSTTPVVVPLSGVTAVYASWRNSGAVADGTYYDWGFNKFGNVGDGATTSAESPVAPALPNPITSVALGGSNSANGQTIVLADGAEYAWGNDGWGQLGDGVTQSAVKSPEVVTSPAPLVAVETGGQSSYGIDTNGNLWGWGDDSAYQLGNPAGGDQLTPSVILTGVAQVSATSNTADALDAS